MSMAPREASSVRTWSTATGTFAAASSVLSLRTSKLQTPAQHKFISTEAGSTLLRTNVADLALLDKRLHRPPRSHKILGEFLVDQDLAVLALWQGSDAAVFGHAEGDGEVHPARASSRHIVSGLAGGAQVKVQVVDVKALERLIERAFDLHMRQYMVRGHQPNQRASCGRWKAFQSCARSANGTHP
jgi:hypothetical protein